MKHEDDASHELEKIHAALWAQERGRDVALPMEPASEMEMPNIALPWRRLRWLAKSRTPFELQEDFVERLGESLGFTYDSSKEARHEGAIVPTWSFTPQMRSLAAGSILGIVSTIGFGAWTSSSENEGLLADLGEYVIELEDTKALERELRRPRLVSLRSKVRELRNKIDPVSYPETHKDALLLEGRALAELGSDQQAEGEHPLIEAAQLFEEVKLTYGKRLSLQESANLENELGHVYGVSSLYYDKVPSIEKAVDHLKQAWDLGEEAGQPDIAYSAKGNLAAVLLTLGQAQEEPLEALNLADDIFRENLADPTASEAKKAIMGNNIGLVLLEKASFEGNTSDLEAAKNNFTIALGRDLEKLKPGGLRTQIRLNASLAAIRHGKAVGDRQEIEAAIDRLAKNLESFDDLAARSKEDEKNNHFYAATAKTYLGAGFAALSDQAGNTTERRRYLDLSLQYLNQASTEITRKHRAPRYSEVFEYLGETYARIADVNRPLKHEEERNLFRAQVAFKTAIEAQFVESEFPRQHKRVAQSLEEIAQRLGEIGGGDGLFHPTGESVISWDDDGQERTLEPRSAAPRK